MSGRENPKKDPLYSWIFILSTETVHISFTSGCYVAIVLKKIGTNAGV